MPTWQKLNNRCLGWVRFRAEKTMTATDVTGFDAIFSTGFFATFSRFWGARLTKLHREPGEKAKNPVESLQWRRRPEIADFCPLSWSNVSWEILLRSIAVVVSSAFRKSPTGMRDFLRFLAGISKAREPCEPFSPLQPSKTPETPNLSEICPSDCFWGFQSGGLKFGKICQNLSENYRFSNFDKFFQISVPVTGTPKNNRWDKFRTNLGFRAFLKAVRGKRVRNVNPKGIVHSFPDNPYPLN